MHPDDHGMVVERDAAVLAGDATQLREVRVLRLDGSPVEVAVSAARIEFDGQPATQVVFRDITQRKEDEKLYSASHNSRWTTRKARSSGSIRMAS